MGMRDVYDIFLMPFQAAIRDAKLASIMNAYPELDGELVAASHRILTSLLRGELGFDGLIVSDYEAVLMIHNYHNVAADKSIAGRLALTAGIDVELPTIACYGDPLRAALKAGDLNLETVDLSVSRHLQKKIELGLFENPYVDEGRVLEVFETPENRKLAHEIATQSMVLLKNDGLLPLSKTIKTLAIIGPNADNGRNQLGDYSYAATLQLMQFQSPADSSFVDVDLDKLAQHDVKLVTVLEGIQTTVSSDTKVLYAKGCENLSDNTSGFEGAVNTANQADAIVLVLGDHSGLVPSCTTGETRDSADLKLPGVQDELAKAVIATGKPVAVVLVNGRPFAMPWLAENANAILEAWLPGEEGGNAIADILFGNENPGGKLPITFPRSVGQVPIFYNAKPSGMRSNWYVDYVSEKVTPLYSFGHGLSYTKFEYSDLSIGQKQAGAGGIVNISLKVRNVGKVMGDEVIQLYVRDEFASMPRPIKELKGYQRISLKPNEERAITFHLPVDQVAFYDENLRLCVEAGKIIVMVGGSSDDIRLRGEFEIAGGKKTFVKDRVFVCPVSIK
jgi:beta-glucosidase